MLEQQLFDAANEDEVDKVKSILEENHDIDINKLCKIFPNKKWTATTLYIASKNNNHDVVKILLEHPDIDINKKSIAEETPLWVAARNDCEEVARLLLEHGADINLADYLGQTPLYIAVRNNSEEVINILLTYSSVNINQADNNGKTPLMIAIKHDNFEAAKLLLEYGADINLKDNAEKTTISYAKTEEMKDFLTEYTRQYNVVKTHAMLSENKIGYALDAESTQNLYQFIGSGKKKNTKTRRKKYKKRSKTYTKTLWTGPTIPILSLNSL
jgi:ankyrin repeat protein